MTPDEMMRFANECEARATDVMEPWDCVADIPHLCAALRDAAKQLNSAQNMAAIMAIHAPART